MRNMLVGAVLAIVLIAALFAAAHFGSHPGATNQPEQALSPAQVAARLQPDFVGDEKIGDWKLSCGKARTLPQSPPVGGHMSGNSEGKPPADGPPPGWKIPRCRAAVGLRNPQQPSEEIRVTFRPMGFKRALAVFLRLPPSAVETGDQVTLHLDTIDLQIPVRACAARFCLAVDSIRLPNEPAVVSTKKALLILKPASGDKAISVAIPTLGLEAAIAAIRRLDK